MSKKVTVFWRVVIAFFGFSIIIPFTVITVWSFTGRWAWPRLFPESFSLRGVQELFGGYSGALQVLCSSILISLVVAFLAVIIGMMTARALVFYDFHGKELIRFGAILPIIIPGTVFAMGIHVILIRLGLADNVCGVILVHLICALPYSIKIMTDNTAAFGRRLEEQALVLGAPPGIVMTNITLPSLLPGIISSASLAYILSFSQYFITLIIGGGKVKTFSMMMVPYLQSGDRTIASAYSLVFVGSALLIFIIFEKASKKFCKNESEYFFA